MPVKPYADLIPTKGISYFFFLLSFLSERHILRNVKMDIV